MAGRVLIIGITGQDGAYLARALVERGWTVHGTTRRVAGVPWRLVRPGVAARVSLHRLDLTEPDALVPVLRAIAPDAVVNLAGQSSVGRSFDDPIGTAAVNGLGVVRLIEALRRVAPEAHFVQASSSEMFGAVGAAADEGTRFAPVSPYGAAKLLAHWATVTGRTGFGLAAASAIMFNHESPLRGGAFVTSKVARHMAALAAGGMEPLAVGDLDVVRDWGHASDYADAFVRLIETREASELVFGTGHPIALRRFVELAADAAGFAIDWTAEGTGRERRTGRTLVVRDPRLIRPTELPAVWADPSRAYTVLGWRATVAVEALVQEMVESARRDPTPPPDS